VQYRDNTGQNKVKKERPGGSRGQTEVEIWRQPVFLTQRPRLPIWPKVGQSTQLLPVLQSHFRFDHDVLLHAFFKLVNFTTFRALLKVFPVSELYYRATDLDTVHPVFLLKAFLVVHVRYGDNAGQNKAKKERPRSSRGQTRSRNMAATCFSDWATQTFDLSKSSPKYTATSGSAKPLQVLPRRRFTRVFFELRAISRHFGPFRALL